MKFGGSSVEHAEAITQVMNVVESRLQEQQAAVVVSAFRGVTDMLHQSALDASNGDESYKEALQQLENRHIDAIKALLPAKDQGAIAAEVKFKLNELENVLYGLYLIRELSKRSLDFVLGFGERLSARIIAAAFTARGIEADFVDARSLILTDENFGSAMVNKE